MWTKFLPATLAAASAIPYYRSRWGSKWKGVRTLAGLARLPTLDKAEAALHRAELLAPGARSGSGVVSSGTTHTRGPLLQVARSEAERDAAAAYAATWVDWTPSISPAIARGLALEVRAMHHGIPDGPAPAGRLRMPFTFTTTAFRQFAQLLGDAHRGKRVTSLIIGAGALKAMSVWLLENGHPPSKFKVRMIGTNGFRLTRFWRGWLERTWGATLWDNFSLSEFVTPAMECHACGHHHWLSPPVLHEVLDVVSREPISRGVGELTLTSLHPFAQAMPLIRYRTGDLVEIGPRCAAVGARGFSPLGRVSHSILEGNRLLLSAQEVLEVLEAEPLVAMHPHPVETLGLVQSREIGGVKHRLQRVGQRLTLEVELRFDPALFTQAAVEFVQRTSAALRCARLEVKPLRPGSLTAPWSKF